MASKLSEETLQKELIAQRKRAQALAYLEKNACGPGKVESVLNTKGESAAVSEEKKTKSVTSDNTLDLIFNRKILDASSNRNKELESRSSILKQQDELRNQAKDPKEKDTLATLPLFWEEVKDKASGDTYYWNKQTNETSWERPNTLESPVVDNSDLNVDALPAGWVEVVHSSTLQKYYIHQATGEKRWTKPSATDITTDIPKVLNAKVDDGSKRKSKYTEEQEKEKRRRLLIDPLDPTGGTGKWSDGMGHDGKMADSTASGPLWQQRPYPAPGAALKGKERPKGGGDIGPIKP